MSTESLLAGLLVGGITTIEIAVGAWVLSVVVGLGWAIIHDLSPAWVRVLLAIAGAILRGVPQLVVLYVIYFGLPTVGLSVNPFVAAIVGLGVTDAAFSAEYYRAGLLTVTAAQRDAGLSIGLTRFGALRYVILPQIVPYVAAPLLNSFVGLLKTATLASAIGVPEILYRGQLDIEATGQIAFIVAIVIAVYVGVTMPLTGLVARLDQRLRRRTYE